MKEPVCAICKGGKLLCGKKFCPIVQRLNYWKSTIERVNDSFFGTSPPSVFVGRHSYPRVNVGILSPPVEVENAEILDFPEVWYEERLTIRQILDYRSEMINSRTMYDVKRPKGKLLETMQELAMASKATDVEVWLKSRPKFKFSVSNFVPPIGNPATIKEAKIAENVRVPRKVDEVVSDTDLKAGNAVTTLYRHEIPVSKIEKIFSVGLLGLPFQRKLVPTRWSWTAVHNIIGENLRKKVINYPELLEFRLFHAEYIGNHFEILLLPGSYQYELIEIKHPKSVWNPYGKYPAIYSDYENRWGRKTYAENCGGAWYAARIGVLQYLENIKRQAKVLIIREVLPSYYAPLGVWVIENTVKDAMQRNLEKFNTIEETLKRMSERLTISIKKCIHRSQLLKLYFTQRRVKDFVLGEQKKVVRFFEF
jgi:hypothetical protein